MKPTKTDMETAREVVIEFIDPFNLERVEQEYLQERIAAALAKEREKITAEFSEALQPLFTGVLAFIDDVIPTAPEPQRSELMKHADIIRRARNGGSQ